MKAKGPKCKICGKNVQILSYDSAYAKFVKPGEAKATFLCWGCAEKLVGDKLKEITTP